MKRILLLAFLLLPMTSFAEDDFGITVPEWKDFAPSAFVDVKQPKGVIGKMNISANYWYERKVAFEEGLAKCQEFNTNDERFSCYESLKVSQYKQNSDYNARLEAKQNAGAAIPEMRDRTDTMVPINFNPLGLMQYQPNEIN